jgi:hypothetical protein
MNYELPCVLIRFGSEFILSNAKIRCAAAVRAQDGDALGHVTWSWQRGWATSMQPSSFHDTAKVCSNVGIFVLAGPSECSYAVAATQGVSGRLRARQGLRHLLPAATSAFDATNKRHVSTEPRLAAQVIRGVR